MKNQANVNPNEADNYANYLNQICKKTPEGYLITIEQKQFDDKGLDDHHGDHKPKGQKVKLNSGPRDFKNKNGGNAP